MDAVEKEPVKRFVNNVQRGEEQERRLDECGEILELAMAIRMAFVGRFIRDAHREECDDRSKQVQARVQSFGEDAQASRADDEKSLQGNQQHGRADAQQCRSALFVCFLVLVSLYHGPPRLP